MQCHMLMRRRRSNVSKHVPGLTEAVTRRHLTLCSRQELFAACSLAVLPDFLRIEQSWLSLARSYEFGERLLAFSRENHRRRAEFYREDVVR